MVNPQAAIVNATSPRCAGRSELHDALVTARDRTLRLFDCFEQALGPALQVPFSHELNPPLWEFGHIGWFADWWIARNPQRHRGCSANPTAPRLPARRIQAFDDPDALYNSSDVPHAVRWHLPLPDTRVTRAHLSDSLTETLEHLQHADETDQGLYFHRLALFHEDMHAEAALYMAQNLGIDCSSLGAMPHHQTAPDPDRSDVVRIEAQRWLLGHQGPGFAFDNELPATQVVLAAFEIDTTPLPWSRYLAFMDAAGYEQPEFWDEPGRIWLEQSKQRQPRYCRRNPASPSGWEQSRYGQWVTLQPEAPACHLTVHEARAWCRWAGRRLPSEAEWACAAHTEKAFVWGDVWEWTSSLFAPFPGFNAHPYQDYSQPWFGDRPVLKGASWATQPSIRHPVYRNFFPPERNDIFSGFRSARSL